jgi:hypothetical protein
MNCKHVQELLPLYVGHDLDEKHAKLVTAHVQSCAECASSSDEYRETRQLLQQFAPPPFSDAVYAGIRRRVLRQIGRESPAQALPQLVASLFHPSIRWAFATALLLAVCVFAFYFRTNRRNERQQLANSPRTVDQVTHGEVGKSGSQDNKSAVSSFSPSNKSDLSRPAVTGGRNTDANSANARSADRTQQPHQRGAVYQWSSKAVTRADTREASPKINTQVDPDGVGSHDPSSSQKTLRMEIQTKDRNIRIIWFSHQPTKQDSSNESYKGI